MTLMTPILAAPVDNGLLPITLKAIAWLKKHYVEAANPGINPCRTHPTELGDIFSSIADLDTSIRENLKGVTSFIQFLATVQTHEVLARKVKELSQDYWYSTTCDQEAGSVTVDRLYRLLVNFGDAGECWRMLGFHLTEEEAEDVIRLMEDLDDQHDDDNGVVLDKDMVLHKITF